MSRRTCLSFRVVLFDFLWEKSRSSCHFMPFHANLLKRFCEKSPKTTWWHRRNLSQSLQFWNPERWRVPAATVPGHYLALHFAVPTLWKKCAGWGSSVRLCPVNCYQETRSTLAEQGSEGFDWEFCLLCCLFCLFHVIDVQSHCIEDHRRSVNFIIEYHRWISSLNPILESHLWVSSLNPISEFHYWSLLNTSSTARGCGRSFQDMNRTGWVKCFDVAMWRLSTQWNSLSGFMIHLM